MTDQPTINTLWAAQELVAAHLNLLRWTPQRKWLVWNGQRWRVDETHEVAKLAAALITQWQADADTSGDKELWKLVNPRGGRVGGLIREIVDLAAQQTAIQAEDATFDTNPFLLSCGNACTVDLKTGLALTPNPAHYLTRGTEVTYLPDLPDPVHWLEFLYNTLDTPDETIPFLQDAFGYSLSGNVREKAFFLLYGPTNSGKSLILRILRALVGPDYGTEAQLGTFFVKKYHSGPRDEIAELFPFRVVTASEAGRQDELNLSLIKQFVGGLDPIRARQLYERSKQSELNGKLWLASNHLPRIEDTDDSIWQRLCLIHCPQERAMPGYATAESIMADLDLPERLMAEQPLIFNWAVKGAVRVAQQGLYRPQSVLVAGQAYRQEQDYVKTFLEETTTAGSGMVHVSQLYQAYVTWWERNGYDKRRALSQNLFSRDMARRGYEKGHRVDGFYWQDVELRPLAQTVAVERN